MEGQFDIIRYLSGLTGFVFDKDVLWRIAIERGVSDVQDISEIDQKTKDLLFADLLFVIYMSPNSMASSSHKHGTFEQTVGSQTINDKQGIYKMMIALYKKYGDEKLEIVPNASGNLVWME